MVNIGRQGLAADVARPPNASGVVIFAHGSGSSRMSPRNRLVARALNQAGLATVLFDLLTAEAQCRYVTTLGETDGAESVEDEAFPE